MGKNRLGLHKAMKKKKKLRKDEENILSKDIDMDEEMKELEKMADRNGIQREMSNINYSRSFIKNLKFRPLKYKGTYLPYHLRWIFGNSIKTNEITLIQEIKALENEIVRLKQSKLLNREFRKLVGLPYGLATKPCPCCNRMERKNHDCPHNVCEPDCLRKKAEAQFNNTFTGKVPRVRGMYDDAEQAPPQRTEPKVFFATQKDLSKVEGNLTVTAATESPQVSSNVPANRHHSFIIKKDRSNMNRDSVLKTKRRRRVKSKEDCQEADDLLEERLERESCEVEVEVSDEGCSTPCNRIYNKDSIHKNN